MVEVVGTVFTATHTTSLAAIDVVQLDSVVSSLRGFDAPVVIVGGVALVIDEAEANPV